MMSHAFILAAQRARAVAAVMSLANNEGAGKAGCQRAPAVRVQKKVHAAEPQVWPDHPAFPAQWFYGLYVISPATNSFCHRRRAD
jgi:hypothetical protein